jgi:hypothetical protein
VERFDLKKLNYGKVKEQYNLNFVNRLAALENLNDNGDMNWASDIIRVKIKFSAKQTPGYYDLKIRKFGCQRDNTVFARVISAPAYFAHLNF